MKGAGQISAPPELRQKIDESAPDVQQKLPSLEPAVQEPKRIRKPDVAKEDLDAGLGLLDHILESDDNYQVSAEKNRGRASQHPDVSTALCRLRRTSACPLRPLRTMR